MRRIPLVLLALAGAVLLVPAGAQAAEGPEGILSGEAEAFAVRVEYDIPLPAGAGTIPHVIGEVRRASTGGNAKGLAAAPSHLDAVVGGKYANPDQETEGDESRLPQTECFYPGDLVDTRFRFPTDNRPENAGAPAIGYAIARCAEGPMAELHARDSEIGGEGLATAAFAPALTAAQVAADALIGPQDGELSADASARAADLVLAGGAVTIGSVEVDGRSSVTGKAGEQATRANVTVNDVVVGGGAVRFSLADDRILVGGEELPVGSDAARQVIAGANAALAASGCELSVISSPSAYPQGFLLSRKEPKIGVAEDGSFAASMRGGLLLVCDVPEQLSGNTDLNPQRLQLLIGFVYTSTTAGEDPGGFDLTDLGSAIGAGPITAAPLTETGAATSVAAPVAAPPPEAAPAVDGGDPAGDDDDGVALGPVQRLASVPMSPKIRLAVGLVAAAGFLAFTQLAGDRLRRELAWLQSGGPS
jgi:hypothetical protein